MLNGCGSVSGSWLLCHGLSALYDYYLITARNIREFELLSLKSSRIISSYGFSAHDAVDEALAGYS